jgi:hypothetical protein
MVLGASNLSYSTQKWELVPKQQQRLDLPPFGPIDIWERSAQWHQIVSVVQAAGGCSIAPAVWTHHSERIQTALSKADLEVGCEVEATHGKIFNWNCRTGMRDFFLSIPYLAKYCIPSLVCHDVEQIHHAARRLRSSNIVLKSNFSMGGHGVLKFGPEDPFSKERLEGTYQENRPSNADGASKQIPWRWRNEPYLLECFVGEPTTNVSVTSDALISRSGTVAVVGISEQLLSNGFSYLGVKSLPVTFRPVRMEIIAAMEAVGESLKGWGYRGYFNVDFGVTSDGTIFVCDLNVRRSAPLDVHMILRRLGSRIDHNFLYWSADRITSPVQTEDDLCERLNELGSLFDGRRGLLPLSQPTLTGGKAMTAFPKLHVQGSLAPGDGGQGIGLLVEAAFEATGEILGRRSQDLRRAFWTRQPRPIASPNIPMQEVEFAARLLMDGGLILTCGGDVEPGPRALGMHSILACARSVQSRERINTIVKRRERYRPFGGLITVEAAQRWFDGAYFDDNFGVCEQANDGLSRPLLSI